MCTITALMADVDVDRVAYHICITMSLRGIQARSFDPTIVVLDTQVRFPVRESCFFTTRAHTAYMHSTLYRVMTGSGYSTLESPLVRNLCCRVHVVRIEFSRDLMQQTNSHFLRESLVVTGLSCSPKDQLDYALTSFTAACDVSNFSNGSE